MVLIVPSVLDVLRTDMYFQLKTETTGAKISSIYVIWECVRRWVAKYCAKI